MAKQENRINKNTIFSALKYITSHPLNRDKKYLAVKRFIYWQLISRLSTMPIISDFVNNSRLILGNGIKSGSVNYYTGLEEPEDMFFVLHVLREGDLFVDVGANTGVFTILASACAGANCMSFEPVPKTFDRLTDNIRLNGIENMVEAFNIGLASKEDVLRFTTELDTENHIVLDSEKDMETIDVAVKKLDDLMTDRDPTVIKIDVEGFEAEVIAGALKTISKESVLAIIMEFVGNEKRYGHDENKLISQMHEMGYRSYTYSPFKRQLIADKDDLDYLSHKNSIFIKNIEAVRARVENAASFTTNNGCEF